MNRMQRWFCVTPPKPISLRTWRLCLMSELGDSEAGPPWASSRKLQTRPLKTFTGLSLTWKARSRKFTILPGSRDTGFPPGLQACDTRDGFHRFHNPAFPLGSDAGNGIRCSGRGLCSFFVDNCPCVGFQCIESGGHHNGGGGKKGLLYRPEGVFPKGLRSMGWKEAILRVCSEWLLLNNKQLWKSVIENRQSCQCDMCNILTHDNSN